ncbi:SH3 domain-containing protein [Streptococcus sp. 29887]|uniref:SH3 domain-containing protein n=1 Tax=Streptococcus iners TaxID=3028084 RepID=A0AA96VIT4_9STRE|nr:SH3 domain-containing protein [Streptococcus sp. 29887]WNY50605.1 SH3 domain-containing protein [Streptococcus sp. 29887]
MRRTRFGQEKQNFSIRKYSLGAASVLIGTSLVFGLQDVKADEQVGTVASSNLPLVQVQESSQVDKTNSLSNQVAVETKEVTAQTSKVEGEQVPMVLTSQTGEEPASNSQSSSEEARTEQAVTPTNQEVAVQSSPAVELPQTTAVAVEEPVAELAPQGQYIYEKETAVKNQPSKTAPVAFYAQVGDKVNYDKKLEVDGHQWISYLSYSGTRRYVDLGQVASSPATAPSQPVTSPPPVTSQSNPTPQLEKLASRGSYHFSKQVAVKNEAKLTAPTQFTFEKGDKVNYDKTLVADGHQWISYLSYSGTRRYVDLGQVASSPATAPSQPVTSPPPVTSQSNPSPQVEKLASRGSYHFSKQVAVKNEAKAGAPTQFTFEKGDKVNYDKTLEADGHQWISYLSYSGTRRYVDLGQVASSVATAPSQPAPSPPPVTSQSTPAPQSENLASRGSYHFSKQVAVKNEAKLTAPTQFTFEKGDKVNYDKTLEADGHQWISYLSYSGTRRYVDLGQVASSAATAPSQPVPSTPPVASQPTPAPQAEKLASRGSYHFNKQVAVKNEAKAIAPTQFTFEKGDKVNYDKTLEADGHQWISYLSYSGTRRYVDLGQVASSAVTASTTNLPASDPIENKNEQKTVLSQSGSYTVTKTVPVKNKAENQAPTQFEFTKGEKINYDQVVEADGYRWLSYPSYSGTRRYVRTEALRSTHTQQHLGSSATEQQRLAAQGVYQVTKRVSVTAQPSIQAAEITYYTSGSSITYDKLIQAEGLQWISYLSYSGHRRYVKIDN